MFSILSLFRRKKNPNTTPNVLSVSSTDTTAKTDIAEEVFHNFLRGKMKDAGKVDHASLQAAARVFFHVDLPTRLWRLRYANTSLLYFGIANIHSVFDGDVLSNIRLTLVDESLGTSLKLVIDIRDVPELLVPVFAPAITPPSSNHTTT